MDLVCYAQSGSYRIFYDFLFFITFSFIPPILTIIVGLATLYNIHRTGRQIGTTTTMTINRLRKRDHQFIKMLLIQLTSCVILILSIAIQKIYSTLTENIEKSFERLFIEIFFSQFVRTLTHINSAISFYL